MKKKLAVVAAALLIAAAAAVCIVDDVQVSRAGVQITYTSGCGYWIEF